MPMPTGCNNCGNIPRRWIRNRISNDLTTLTCPECNTIYAYDSRLDRTTLHLAGGMTDFIRGTGQQESRFKRA